MQAGTRLGSYEILASLGAGGMGEVYRARDTKLNREVAVKLLPTLFASDPDRLARFEREAQAVAALSHPNVLAIYDFGTSGKTSYAVMELLDGETLRERIDRGPQAARRSVDICTQIARGLAAAHGKGIVHRDLKPENVFVTREGRVKILDFGLARQMAPSAISADMTMPATDAGTVLGTVGYMAPEQVRAHPADARSDIFALGAILYELVSGRRAFHRESAAETMSAIAREDPPPISSALAAPIPPAVERIIWRCLEKDPTARFQSCHDLAFALESATVDSGTGSVTAGGIAAPSARSRWRPAAAWMAVGVIAGATLSTLGFWRDASSPPSPAVTYDIQMPTGTQLQRVEGRPIVAVSPDGSAIAFVGVSEGVSRLYLRRSNEAEARALAGTEGATDPAFSPDDRWIAFTSNADLKKVSVDGGVTMVSAGTITDDSRGLTWTSPDQIVFSPDPIRGLFRISADGGTAIVLTEPDVAKDERTHRWPSKVIGRNAVLFTVGGASSPDDYENARIDALDLDSGQRVTVLQGASMARHVPGGRLVFARGGALHGVAFDAGTLQTSGPASVVQAGVATDFSSGAAHFAFGLNALAYVHSPASDNQRRLYWFDRDGSRTRLDLAPAVYNDLSFSPDGSKLAMVIGPVGSGDIYIHDLERKTVVRLTFDGRNTTPIWSADGRDIYYASIEPMRRSHVMRKPADGSRDADRLQTIDSRLYLGYLADPHTLVGFTPDRPGPPMRRSDIIELRLGSADPPIPLVATPGQDYGPARSPDGRYLAHVSDSAGRAEIFVRDLSGVGAQWQISLDGGEEPRWSADGRQLFYRAGSRLMVADVDLTPTFRNSAPRVLFDRVYNLRVESGNSYTVNPKTGRFISIGLADTDGVTSPPTLRVVLNWWSRP